MLVKKETMRKHTVFLFATLLAATTANTDYQRNQVFGNDNKVWRVEKNANNTITFFKNDSAFGVPQFRNAIATQCVKEYTIVGTCGSSVAPVAIITPACLGGGITNTLSGQTKTYDIDLKPLVQIALNENWGSVCAGVNYPDSISSYKIANGPWVVNKVDPNASSDYINATSDVPSLEVLL
jgi:hypothetical protein